MFYVIYEFIMKGCVYVNGETIMHGEPFDAIRWYDL